MIAPAVLFFLMISLPESPRWHLLKARRLERQNRPEDRLRIERQYAKAFQTLRTLRYTTIQAARDLVYIDVWLRREHSPETLHGSRRCMSIPWGKWFPNTTELVRQPRCRRAMTAGFIVMALQQLCGVNVFAYYSSSVFKTSLSNSSKSSNLCTLPQADRMNDTALAVGIFMNNKSAHANGGVVLSRVRCHQLWHCNCSGISDRLRWQACLAAHNVPPDGNLPIADGLNIWESRSSSNICIPFLFRI